MPGAGASNLKYSFLLNKIWYKKIHISKLYISKKVKNILVLLLPDKILCDILLKVNNTHAVQFKKGCLKSGLYENEYSGGKTRRCF
jgi:hypothetical protein